MKKAEKEEIKRLLDICINRYSTDIIIVSRSRHGKISMQSKNDLKTTLSMLEEAVDFFYDNSPSPSRCMDVLARTLCKGRNDG